MELTDYILNLGRVVAYYPNLKILTGSTTATILLCQLLYWTKKTKDPSGWIWKTALDIEEETGLTKNEQKTAISTLVASKLISREVKRLDHGTRYRVNVDLLNKKWKDINGEGPDAVKGPEQLDLFPDYSERAVERKAPIKEEKPLSEKQMARMEAREEKEVEKSSIKSLIERKLGIIAENKRWSNFIDFATQRQTKYNENVSVFLAWALSNGFNPIYWTPEKMKTLWPQAFAKPKKIEPEEDFVKAPVREKVFEPEDKKYAPMPKNIGSVKDLLQ